MVSSRTFIAACVLALLPALAPAIQAETPSQPEVEDPNDPLVVEQTIVVTATRSEREVEGLPVSATVLEREDIEAAPAHTPDDVLRSVPGVILPALNSRQQVPSRNLIQMRGVGGSSVLVLLDGVPAMDPYRGTHQLTRLGMEAIERIEIVRGANASLFGNYALGGTINLITRPVDRTGIDLFSSYGSYQTSHTGARGSWLAAPEVGISFSAERFDTNGYRRVVPEIRGPIDIPFWTTHDNLRLRLDLGGSSPVRSTFHAGYTDSDVSLGTPIGTNLTEIFDLSNQGHAALGDAAALSWSLFYQDQNGGGRNGTLNAARDTETLRDVLDVDVRAFGGSLQWSRSVSSSLPLLSFGVDFRDADAEDVRESYRDDVLSLTR
ncbi:MAG TPA: TonB-dependent receptor plug domain-containing protein, partial [Thermoanaerobaculia bacterium]|nr:TonB-dependent receptor plug domain-containing protein [Thermoanaerobaculia bacterium]